MDDPTEDIRRQRLVEINAEPGSREALKPNTARSGTGTNWAETSR